MTEHVSDRGKTVESALKRPARRARGDAESGRGWLAGFARAGLVAKGVSYGVVGVLAIQLAAHAGGKATSREGALATVAAEPFGKVALALLALGFAAYAIWRLTEALLGSNETAMLKDWGRRLGCVAVAGVYVALTAATFKILFGAGAAQSQDQVAHEKTATVLSWPAGPWIVASAGIAIIGAGVWNAYRGLGRKFIDEWRTGQMSAAARTWGTRAGIVGHTALGVVFGLIGVFLAKAAIEYHPREAVGLDGALQELASAGHGRYLLGVVAAGLVSYASFCLFDARFRDVSVGGGDSSSSSRAGLALRER